MDSFQQYNWGNRREKYESVYKSSRDYVFKDAGASMRGDLTTRVAEYKGKAYLHLMRGQAFLAITEKEFEDFVSDLMINNLRKEFQAANRAIVAEFGADFSVNDGPEQVVVPASERSKQMLKRKKTQKRVLQKLQKQQEERAALFSHGSDVASSGSETETEMQLKPIENTQLKESAAAPQPN